MTTPLINLNNKTIRTTILLSLCCYYENANAATLTGAEYFIDATAPWCDSGPAPGSATALTPTDGVWDAIIETINLTGINAGQLAIGTHAVCVRFKNSTGQWGITRFATFNTGRGLAACEYYIDTDPGVNNGQNLPAKDVAFNTNIEVLQKIGISATGLAIGTHTAGIRCRNEWGQWGEVKTAPFEVCNEVCDDDSTCTTNPATNVAATSATLHGSVTSNNATAAASFDFGTTTAYGTNIDAVPAQIYSSTPVAISANKTDLACNTTYHFRTKAVASNGTCLGADETFTTTCPANAWLDPLNPIVVVEREFEPDLYVKSDSTKVGLYDFVIKYENSKLAINYEKSASQCNKQAVCPGENGWSNYTVTIAPMTQNGIVYNTIRVRGMDAIGAGPDNNLKMLKFYLKAQNQPGITPISLKVNALETTSNNPIGLQNSDGGGSVLKISIGLCGDADGNVAVNIIDALAVARKVVGLPPPPTINDVLADVNKNGEVDIIDALFIARYSVGLVLLPEACNIGQPL